jgi:hypothetical protein
MSTDTEVTESMRAVGDLAPVEIPSVVETIFAVTGASAVRGALGTVYFSMTTFTEPPLVVLDYDLKPIETALPTYLDEVTARLTALRSGFRVVSYPEDIALYVEPAGLGSVVLLEAQKHGHDVREIGEDICALKLEERATPALVRLHAGMVKFAHAAFEKTVNFRGTAANHLRRQISEHTPEQRADTAELLMAWCAGILQALP